MTNVLVEPKQPVTSPFMEEAIRNGGEKLDAQVAESIDNLLCTYEQYAPDSAVYQTVVAELDVLCDGEDFAKPQLIVVHDQEDAVTAFSTPGYIVIGSNIVRHLAKEELDGLLAHELTHGLRGHTKQRLAKNTQIEQVGRKRIGEFEADMLPLELLDRKGINPWGMVSMFNKLESLAKANQPEVEPQRPYERRKSPTAHFRIDDYDHGNIVDRRVNTEEMLKVADVRHLSPGRLTQFPLTDEDFSSYQRDSDLLAQYESLPIDNRRRLIIRQLRSSEVTATANRPNIIRMASGLISEIAPGLEETDRALALEMIDNRFAPSQKMARKNGKVESQDTTPISATLDPEELLERMYRLLTDAGINQHHLVPRDMNGAYLVYDVLSRNLEQQKTLPNAEAYSRLVSRFDLKGAADADVLWKPAVNLIRTDPMSQPSLDYANAIAADLGTSSYVLTPLLLTDSTKDVHEPPEMISLRLAVESRRLGMVRQCTDIVEILQLAASCGTNARIKDIGAQTLIGQKGFGLEYPAYGGNDFNALDNKRAGKNWTLQDENAFLNLLQEELSAMDASELLDLIRFHRREGVLKSSDNNLFALVLWTEISRSEVQLLDTDLKTNIDAANILAGASFADKLALGGLLADKKEMLRFIDSQFVHEAKVIDELASSDKAAKLMLKHLRSIFNAHQAVNRLGFDTDWNIDPQDLASVPELQSSAFHLIVDLLGERKISFAAQIATQVPLPALERVRSNEEEYTALADWENAVNELLNSPKKLGTSELELLACLSYIAPDLATRLNVPPRVLRDISGQLPFDEAVDFIANGIPSLPRHLFLDALNDLIEERASSPQELMLLIEKLGNRLMEFVDDASGTIGKLSLVDAILLPNYGQMPDTERVVGVKRDTILGLEAKKLLITMLSTARSDEPLSQYILERWWSLMRTSKQRLFELINTSVEDEYGYFAGELDEVAEAFKIEDILWLKGDGKQLKRRYWVSTIPINQPSYKPLQEVVDNAISASAGMKYYYLRKLLLDEGYGVLHSSEDSAELIDQFIGNWLDNPNDDAAQFIRESLQSLTDVTDPELLYQHIYPLLMDIVLLPPEQRTDTKELAYKLADSIFDDLYTRGQFGHMDRNSPQAIDALAALREKVHGLVAGSSQLRHELESEIQKSILRQRAEEIRHAMEMEDNDPGRSKLLRDTIKSDIEAFIELERERIAAQLNLNARAVSASDALKVDFAPEITRIPEGQRLSAIDLLFKLGERSGALGTRMLQLGGMYFDMPEEQREKFAHVYDDMKGQTRLQAWRTLQREATHSQAIQDLLDNLAELKPRIGGGSLMTVYEGITTDGKREAIAIKNPNIEYHLGKMVSVLDYMLEDLQAKRADEYRIGLVQSLLEDVAEWIHDELADPTFEAKDLRFRATNDFRESGYQPTKNRYKMLVPQSIATGTRWVRRDEFIEGRNLSGLKVVEDDTDIGEGKINAQDYRQAISLLVHNYVYQLTQTGLVHSDVHPGNFRITEDNQALAVFDRYNLLEFSDSEQQIMRQVLRTVATGNTIEGLGAMVEYMLSLPENAGVDQETVRQLIADVTGQVSDLTEVGPQLLLTLKQSGVKVPVKYTLVMKNILSLQRFSKKAGFNGIADAYLATADTSELLRLLQ